MKIVNVQNEKIPLEQFISLFDESLPPGEVVEGVYFYHLLAYRENGIVIKLSFIYYENFASIEILKDQRIISLNEFSECAYIRIVNQEDKIFEIVSLSISQPSTTILSIKGEPILHVYDFVEKKE